MKFHIALALITIVGCSGCASHDAVKVVGAPSPVDIVKNGVLPSPYNTAKIGHAFDSYFEDGVWKSFKTGAGATVVEFDGTLLSGKLSPSNPKSLPVKVQFTFVTGSSSFKLSSIDAGAACCEQPETLLNKIYN